MRVQSLALMYRTELRTNTRIGALVGKYSSHRAVATYKRHIPTVGACTYHICTEVAVKIRLVSEESHVSLVFFQNSRVEVRVLVV